MERVRAVCKIDVLDGLGPNVLEEHEGTFRDWMLTVEITNGAIKTAFTAQSPWIYTRGEWESLVAGRAVRLEDGYSGGIASDGKLITLSSPSTRDDQEFTATAAIPHSVLAPAIAKALGIPPLPQHLSAGHGIEGDA